MEDTWLDSSQIDFVGAEAHYKGERVFIKQLWYKEEDPHNFFRCLSLQPHPNILLPLGFARPPKTDKLKEAILQVSPFVEDGSLGKYLQTHANRLPWSARLNILKQVADAMDFLHKHDFLHHNLKPNNILIANTASKLVEAKVCDFVNSGDAPREEDLQMSIVGKELYIAPEVILKKPFTKLADVFSFGIVMYDLITLQPPGRRYPLFNYAFRPEIRFKGDAPKGLWELMLACISIDPSQRPTFDKILERLENVGEEPDREAVNITDDKLMDNQKVVVLVGTIQSGKSSFIKFLHDYARVSAPADLLIGNGNKPCTVEVRSYSLSLHRTSFKSAEGSNTWQELMKAGKPVERFTSKETISVRVIDTPGLDDAEAEDESQILRLLRTLDKLPYITTVVFVVNSTVPFSRSVISYFKYYQQMVPQLRHDFVILHTRYGAKERILNERRKLKWMDERAKSFQELTSLDCDHFFIENLPGSETIDPYLEEVDINLSQAVVTSFLNYLMAKNNTALSGISYRKTPTIKQAERIIATMCKSRIVGYPMGIAAGDAALGEALVVDGRRISKKFALAGKITRAKEALENLLRGGGEGTVTVGAVHIDAEKTILRAPPQPIEVKSPEVIEAKDTQSEKIKDDTKQKDKILIIGYNVACSEWCSHEEASADLSKGVASVSTTISSSQGMGLDGSLVAVARSSDVYRNEVKILQGKIAKFEKKLGKVLAEQRKQVIPEERQRYLVEFEELGKILSFTKQDFCSLELCLHICPVLLKLLDARTAELGILFEGFRLLLSQHIEGWEAQPPEGIVDESEQPSPTTPRMPKSILEVTARMVVEASKKFPPIPFENITLDKVKGHGNQGTVYAGVVTYPDKTKKVAIKSLWDPNAIHRKRPGSEELTESALQAIQTAISKKAEREHVILAAMVTHPHIVKYLGISFFYHPTDVNQSRVYILTELVEGPNLYDCYRANTLNDKLLVRVFMETADAMKFMHSMEYIHRNLKTANLLLDEESHVKICGFGISRPAPTENDGNMTNELGSARWSAPEVLKNERYGKPADVFSFGVIISELLTETVPKQRTAFSAVPWNFIPKGATVSKHLIPAKGTTRGDLWELMLACTKYEPTARPTFDDIYQQLCALDEKVAERPMFTPKPQKPWGF